MRVSLISLGCPKNTVDSERLLGLLAAEGAVICGSPEDADAVIIATCSFIEPARDESASVIEEMLALKKNGIIKTVIVSGCMVEHLGQELGNLFPEVDAFVGFGAFKNIKKIIEKSGRNQGKIFCPELSKTLGYEGARLRITGGNYAYLRVTEGCNNKCSYCSIPSIRGSLRSKSISNITREARELAAHGAGEIILIGEDVTAWGDDLPGKPDLTKVIEKLEKIADLRWIRILYAYPSRISDGLIRMLAEGGKLLPYLDIPIQHSETAILKRMRRRYTGEKLRKTLEKILTLAPDVVLRTSVITGFPGETKKEHDGLLGLINEGYFKRLGCFIYSDEKGTRAHSLGNKITSTEAERRRNEIMEAATDVLVKFHNSLKGKELDVALDLGLTDAKYTFLGRTIYDAPLIDTNLFVTGRVSKKEKAFTKVRITGVRGIDLTGEVIK